MRDYVGITIAMSSSMADHQGFLVSGNTPAGRGAPASSRGGSGIRDVLSSLTSRLDPRYSVSFRLKVKVSQQACLAFWIVAVHFVW